ncbi:TPA: hypothetical protein ACGO1H_000006 [Streptococcus suis]
MKKMINYSLILLSVTCLMTACASKTQETQTKTSTSKTTQSSTKQSSTKQSSSTNSSKAEKTQESTSEQTNSTSTEVSTSTSTEKSQQTGETTTSTTEENVISSETTQTQLLTLPAAPVPETLVGKWQGSSQQARNIEVTVSADGTFTTHSDFRQSEDEDADYLIQNYTAQITDLVEYSPNHYLIRGAEGEYSALLPGMTGLGGRITPGFILEDGQYKVIMWGNPYDSSIEAKYDLVSEPHVFVSLEKVE